MPSSPPPPPPPGICSRPRKPSRRLSLKAFRSWSWQPPSGRDWAELPVELILYVFHMLDPVELLLGGARGVCRSWRRAARDEPVLWRLLDMRGYRSVCSRSHVPFLVLVQAAVRRSEGQCEAFWTDCGDDDVLHFLADEECPLKSLCLIYSASSKGLQPSMMKFPLLEELELSECSNYYNQGVFEAIAISCPRLKHLRYINDRRDYGYQDIDDREAIAIASMHALCSLELYHNHLTNKTLITILNNCTQLELLILHHCPTLTVNSTLLAKCAGMKIVTLRGDDYAYYELTKYYRTWCSTCDFLRTLRDAYYDDLVHLVDGFFPEDIEDYTNYSRYLHGVCVTDLDDEEYSRMLSKSLHSI